MNERSYELPLPQPSLKRIFAVWRRHQRVYFKFLVANIMPPLLEPLVYILAVGVGLGTYISLVGNVSYVAYIVPGMISVSAMWSASFETTYGTFIRMEYEKIYEAILASPVSFSEMLLGEVLWVASKASMFSLCICVVLAFFGLVESWWAVLVLPAGFLGGIIFALLGILVTSQVREINNFNFYLTGVITPMYFFSGAIFPLEQLPHWLISLCRLLPMTHLVALIRACCDGSFTPGLWISLGICLAYTGFLWPLAENKLRARIIV